MDFGTFFAAFVQLLTDFFSALFKFLDVEISIEEIEEEDSEETGE